MGLINFCHACGCRVMEDPINNIDEVIITDYFYHGFQYSAFIGLLKKHQRLCIHLRTLKRKLEELGLKQRAANCNELFDRVLSWRYKKRVVWLGIVISGML